MICCTPNTDESRLDDPVRSGPDDARLNQESRRKRDIIGRVVEHEDQGNRGRDFNTLAAEILKGEDLESWHRHRKLEEAVIQFFDVMNAADGVTYVIAIRCPDPENFSNHCATDAIDVVLDAVSQNAEDMHVDLKKVSTQYLDGQPTTAAVWQATQNMNRRKGLYFCIAWQIDGENIARFDFSDNYEESRARKDLANCLAECFELELDKARSEEYE